jgi:tetratricopeptide (TPR) repeat protein
MTPERWNRVVGLFHAALEVPTEQREEFLAQQCRDDEEYKTVSDMIAEHAQSGFLDHPPGRTPEAQPVFSESQIVAGRYKIIRFVGHGGMGEVYEAQDLELKERVALKTLLPAIASDPRMIARFKQEIQLSRKISHPNVCRVFDLARHPADGSSSETVVFLTMEFLDGETLAGRLQRDGPLAPQTALPLLEQISEGLDAAHRAGIIHRDLKPSNIMLTPASEGPRVVVTDFGLARSFVPSGETTATLSGQPLGTPDYMAPELLTNHRATVSSDIYAMGMVAYKMVTGALPFASEAPLAAAILRSRAPVPAPRSLVPELDPAWDRAILKALDPDPTRRFSNAQEFVEALFGEAASVTVPLPVMTRRRVAGAIASVVVLAAGGVGWRTWSHYRDRLPAEAVAFYQQGVSDIHAGAYFAATKALEKAVGLAPHFSVAHARLAEAWNELDASERASREMQVARREDFSRLAELERLQIDAIDLTITREFDGALSKYEQIRRRADPSDTRLDVDLGRAYERASQPAKAIESFRRAVEGPSRDPAAWLHLGMLYGRASVSSKSAEAFRNAEELYQASSNLEGLTQLAYQRGFAANSRGQLDEAELYLRQALETAHLAGNTHQEITAELQLGINAYLAGDGASAERYAREALDTARANQMESLAISGLLNLGNAYLRKHDFSGAEKYYQDGFSLARRNNSPHLIALSFLSLAALHDQLNRSADTAREAQEALRFYQANRYARETLQCLTLLGRAESGRGNNALALDFYQKSLRIAEQSQDRLQMALAHESLGNVFFAQERYRDALEHYRKNLELSTDNEHSGYARLQCGDLLWRLGHYTEARNLLKEATAMAEKLPSLRLSIATDNAEMALSELRYADAAALARRALREAGPDRLAVAQLTRVLGLSLLRLGAKGEGIRRCRESLAMAAKLDAPAVLLSAQLSLVQAQVEIGDRSAALELISQLHAALSTRPESRWRTWALIARFDHQYVLEAQQALRVLKQQWGDEAVQSYFKRPDVQTALWPLGAAISATR